MLKNAFELLVPEMARPFEAIECLAQFPDKVFFPHGNIAWRLGKIDSLVFRHFAIEER